MIKGDRKMKTINDYILFQKVFILCFTFFCFANTLVAQNLEWAKAVGGSSGDAPHSIAVDNNGNVYTVGYFENVVDFDPNIGTSYLTSSGDRDIFIQKLDAVGNLVWAKSIGGTSADVARSIVLDAGGNIYTIGNFQGTVDFDPNAGVFNLIALGGKDIFIQKLDSSGNLVWAKSMSGLNDEEGTSIAIDSLGYLYTAGLFLGSVDFDPDPVGVSMSTLNTNRDNIFVQKLDSSGNLIWVKEMGGSQNNSINYVTVDNIGNVYATGYFQGNIDFDPNAGVANLSSAGNSDWFIQKLDSLGDLVWVKGMGGTSFDVGNCVKVDNQGNVFVTGTFLNTVDFDPNAGVTNLTSGGTRDIFIQKLDALGNLVWAKRVGSTGTDIGDELVLDQESNVYITGVFDGTVDFDPNIGVNYLSGSNAPFVQKLDSLGNFIWAKSFNGTSFNRGHAIVLDATNDIYTTGFFGGTTDFDFNTGTNILTSNGSSDIYVVKINQCTIDMVVDTILECNSYTWIDGVTYTSDNNTATYTLTNIGGCDSMITLNLTINTIDTLVTSMDSIITANATGASYQWLYCDSSNSMIQGEIAQSFIALSNGSYAVEISQNGCIDTSECIIISTLLGLEDIAYSNNVSVYPNPTSGNVTINLGDLDDVTISVYNTMGQLTGSYLNINTSLYSFDIKDKKGAYIIKVTSRKKSQFLKLIKI